MRVTATILAITATSMLAFTAAAADQMKLRRVLMSQGGVAYYEFAAEVDGPSDLEIDVPRDQLDDVLKSLVVFDERGAVAKVSLPGEAPLSEALRGLPFGEGELHSLPALLQALRGEQVAIAGPRSVNGRILSVDEILSPAPGGGSRHRLSIMTEQGLEQIFLDEAERVSFVDPDLTAAVNRALDAFAGLRGGDSKRLSISQNGQGRREVRVGYVAAAPLWKTSYRLSVANGEGRLQGWAILENYSGQDWDDVDLTLTSGNPVTFHQALYQAYFVERPEVPVELYGRILPPVDEGTMESVAAAAAKRSTALYERAQDSGGVAAAPPAPQAATSGIARVSDAATQITFTIERPVTLAAGQSLMLPLVDERVPARRVAHIGSGKADVLAAVALENRTSSALPPGVLTVYEQGSAGLGYLGDARIGLTAAGEERLLAFAADTKVKITERADSSQDITDIRISDGVLRMTRVVRHQRSYDAATPKGEARKLMIDIPAPPSWTLIEPKDRARKTADGYRLEADIAGGQRQTVRAVFEERRSEGFALLDMEAETLIRYAEGGGFSNDAARALRAVAERKQMVTAAERRLKTAETRYQEAATEQERLRESVKSVTATSDLAKRYMEKLAELEDSLENLAAERRDAQNNLEAAREQLRSFIRGLKVG